jgi:lipopolysaccharide/colanic/teichoic acid biosynthesis glycosyltransferase
MESSLIIFLKLYLLFLASLLFIVAIFLVKKTKKGTGLVRSTSPSQSDDHLSSGAARHKTDG